MFRSTGGLLGVLVRDERGQDMLEYALLASLIGVAGILVFQGMTAVVGGAYQGWDTGVQNVWEPPDPI